MNSIKVWGKEKINLSSLVEKNLPIRKFRAATAKKSDKKACVIKHVQSVQNNVLLVKTHFLNFLTLLKPGFHMSGKSQTIRDFTFCRPSQILPIFRIICPRFSRDARFTCDRGTGAQKFRRLVMSEIHRRRSRRYNFEF